MADREHFRTLLNRIYTERLADNANGMLDCFSADATAEIAGSPRYCPAASRVAGHANVKAFMQQLIDNWEFMKRAELSTLFDGDKAAVHSRVTIRFRPTGEVIETELYDLWTLQGDKISGFIEFADTAMVNAAIAGKAA